MEILESKNIFRQSEKILLNEAEIHAKEILMEIRRKKSKQSSKSGRENMKCRTAKHNNKMAASDIPLYSLFTALLSHHQRSFLRQQIIQSSRQCAENGHSQKYALNGMYPSNHSLQGLGNSLEKEIEKVQKAEEMDDIKRTMSSG